MESSNDEFSADLSFIENFMILLAKTQDLEILDNEEYDYVEEDEEYCKFSIPFPTVFQNQQQNASLKIIVTWGWTKGKYIALTFSIYDIEGDTSHIAEDFSYNGVLNQYNHQEKLNGIIISTILQNDTIQKIFKIFQDEEIDELPVNTVKLQYNDYPEATPKINLFDMTEIWFYYDDETKEDS